MGIFEIIISLSGIALVLILLAFALKQNQLEKRCWNKGVAPSGSEWRLCSCDSQGGRAYQDPEKPYGAWLWVGSNVDKDYR